MDTSICRSSSRSASAPGICFYVLPYPFHRYGKLHFQGERILVNKWSYGLRVPFHVALFLIIVGAKVLYGNKIL